MISENNVKTNQIKNSTAADEDVKRVLERLLVKVVEKKFQTNRKYVIPNVDRNVSCTTGSTQPNKSWIGDHFNELDQQNFCQKSDCRLNLQLDGEVTNLTATEMLSMKDINEINDKYKQLLMEDFNLENALARERLVNMIMINFIKNCFPTAKARRKNEKCKVIEENIVNEPKNSHATNKEALPNPDNDKNFTGNIAESSKSHKIKVKVFVHPQPNELKVFRNLQSEKRHVLDEKKDVKALGKYSCIADIDCNRIYQLPNEKRKPAKDKLKQQSFKNLFCCLHP